MVWQWTAPATCTSRTTATTRIRKVSAAGIIDHPGGRGHSATAGWAYSASLNQPSGVARDSAGNTYIADTSNNRVRKVAANGTVTTVAGTGASGLLGRRRRCGQRRVECPARRGGGRLRQPVHRGQRQLPRPESGRLREHHDGGGQRKLLRLLGRRRPGHQRADRLSLRSWRWTPPGICIFPTTTTA